jgi:hypothetical protein
MGIGRPAWAPQRQRRNGNVADGPLATFPNVVDGPSTTFPNVVDGPLATFYGGRWAIHHIGRVPARGGYAGDPRLSSGKPWLFSSCGR